MSGWYLCVKQRHWAVGQRKEGNIFHLYLLMKYQLIRIEEIQIYLEINICTSFFLSQFIHILINNSLNRIEFDCLSKGLSIYCIHIWLLRSLMDHQIFWQLLSALISCWIYIYIMNACLWRERELNSCRGA